MLNKKNGCRTKGDKLQPVDQIWLTQFIYDQGAKNDFYICKQM